MSEVNYVIACDWVDDDGRETTRGFSMVNLNIEIPDELHKRLKVAAVVGDTTVKQLVVEILQEK